MVLERSYDRALKLGLFLLAALALLIALPGRATAQEGEGWKVCNQTSFIVETSVGRPVGRSVVVEGWTKIKPGDCRIVLPGPLEPGVHFLFSRSSMAHRGGVRQWAGDKSLCVDVTGSFSVESPPDCAAMGLEQKYFQPVLIGRRTNWETVLEDNDNFAIDKARAAGVQRLLDDAGVYSGAIDGYIGRKTRASIAEFLDANDLDSDMSDEDLIDILEQAAIDRSRNVGLTLCNRTQSRIWAAIARKRATEGWESRGWWQIEAGGCARAIDEELLLTQHFIYGEMEAPGGVRKPLRGSDNFCVARAKFAISGRESCEASAYRTEKFVGTQPPQEGKLVYEFFERDFGPVEAED